MSTRPRVLLGVTPVAERAIEHLLFADPASLDLAASATDAAELTAAVTAAGADGALICSDLPGLDSGTCERLRARGLRVIGVALDDHDQHALGRLPIDATVRPDATPQQLADAFEPHDHEPAPTTPRPALSEPSRDDDGGAVVAVVGCKGAPGATECAASLAALASHSWEVVLAEIDLLGGSLAVRAGADPSRGSLLGLVRAAHANGHEPIGELLDRWLHHARGWPPLLTAPRDPEAVRELAAPGGLTAALTALRAHAALTVCDVGFLLNDAASAARAHRQALVGADAVLLVLGPRDAHAQAGVDQLDLLLDDLAIAPERLRIAVNAVGAPGEIPRAELERALTNLLADRGLAIDAWLPYDPRAATRAQRLGAPLAMAGRRGAFAKALRSLLGDVFLPTTNAARPSPRRRKRQLRAPGTTRAETEEVALPWHQ